MNNARISLVAEREVAYTSPDYIQPWGARRDNSRNRRFNEKLCKLFQALDEPLRVLDLGCSGGGFVKDCLDDGCLAIGLEGNDYSKRFKRAEWALIPDSLFTCDITADFELLIDTGEQRERMLFDVVTSWEVIEHIATQDLAKVVANVRKHLKTNGLWIMSISPNEEVIAGVKLHQTVQQRQWWISKLEEFGFSNMRHIIEYFCTQFVRGPKFNAPGSFHLALSPDPAQCPKTPPFSLLETVYDRWLGSRTQRLIEKWIVGPRR